LDFLQKTKVKNNSFDFEFEHVTTKRTLMKLYLNGQQKYSARICLGSFAMSMYETINISHGHFVSDNDTSINEMITCEVDKNNTLILKMNMNFFSSRNATDAKAIATEIWKVLIGYVK
jgi:hypothetical protein